jgi:predicted  nucleic acid-binding Zn-ribbon protein
MEAPQMKPKSFWKRPEGITGLMFLAALLIGGGYLITTFAASIMAFIGTTIGLVVSLAVLGAIVYMVLDPKMRNLIFYMYKSVMRSVTGMFVQIDPIGILKTYVEELQGNLRKMNKQISQLRAQMHKLKEVIVNNEREINSNLKLAGKAKETNKRNVMILKSRRAGRLKDSNIKLETLYKKMEVLYRVLTKMYENSQILAEDIKDQVAVKEQERKAIHASHGAMKSAMSVISGDPDQRAMFDMAMENITEDVANKVGEMERFMEVSANFMDSVDLQNGVFEEEGMNMLEQWENESTSLLLGEEKSTLLLKAESDNEVLDLDAPVPERARQSGGKNQYDSFFD